MSRAWTVRLGHQAGQDYFEILRWTTKTFGEVQAKTYAETISLAIQALRDGPEVLGAKARDEIEPGMRTLHVARQGRKGRHFVVFRAGAGQIIDVLRLLHDSMDLARHVPAANDQPH
ncbi:type II toxin-antitoxin system RelE/ParE family toxin [Ramlibacter sp. 2FC]|uniref:type II toxin-antitoxin system RelE/ParE family toxin n=1 Tax=Ramlibacter sp. 2FC TaxID=2502188 RepID=UPI0010F445AF|nr:type II toxin-antitoxin system RelE/ParE family toxin [Ramlibacter sp. 2FC]